MKKMIGLQFIHTTFIQNYHHIFIGNKIRNTFVLENFEKIQFFMKIVFRYL